MSVERWGTLSVKDHLNLEALVGDLLLYDRLVFPVFSGVNERTRWRDENWDPDLQESQIEWLGDLAVKAEWDEQRIQQFVDLRNARKEIAEDAFQTTRRVLAMSDSLPMPVGVTEIRAVAAYHDLDEGKRELKIVHCEPDAEALGKLGFAMFQQLLLPSIDFGQKPENLLKRAAELSREGEYQKKRSAFYAWQESAMDSIVRGRKSIDTVVMEMQTHVSNLNDEISRRWTKLAFKTVLTVVGVAVPFALGIEKIALLTAIPGAFELVKFGALEATETPAEAKCEVAAMLLSAKKSLS
ncbi:MAG: hypothetical protein ABL919_00265 [Methylococcales bacterium]